MRNVLFVINLIFVIIASAQTKTTKEAKVIAVVVNNTIKALEFFENSDSKRKQLFKKYPKAKFFIGVLKGKYDLDANTIIPKNEAIIILYTERQIFNREELFKDKKLIKGNLIRIGKMNAKIITAKKGELIIETYN